MTSEHSQSEHYFKAKRNLAIFVGLLFISIFFRMEKKDGSPENFFNWFEIAHERVPDMFAAIVLYSLFQYILNWYLQISVARGYKGNCCEILLSIGITAVALGFYVNSLGLVTYFIVVTFVTTSLRAIEPVGVNFVEVVWNYIAHRIGNLMGNGVLKQPISIPSNNLEDVLIENIWILYFNPRVSMDRKKKIEFKDDYTIGVGANHNECSWRVVNGFLEILSESDNIQSRFKYSLDDEKFVHTNDRDTLSKRDQIIEKA